MEVGANLQLQNAEQGILRDMPPCPENWRLEPENDGNPKASETKGFIFRVHEFHVSFPGVYRESIGDGMIVDLDSLTVLEFWSCLGNADLFRVW